MLLLECSTREWRGGNSKYTRNLRCAHDLDPECGLYSAEELASDLRAVTGDGSDSRLTQMAVERSREAPAFLASNGVRWQPALSGTLQLARTNRFFLGGGKALLNVLYRTAQELGVTVAYEHSVEELIFEGERCTAVGAVTPAGRVVLRPTSIVAAAGGFEANLAWISEYWGAAVHIFVAGLSQNDGTVLRLLLNAGASQRGNPRGFHAIAVDARGSGSRAESRLASIRCRVNDRSNRAPFLRRG